MLTGDVRRYIRPDVVFRSSISFHRLPIELGFYVLIKYIDAFAYSEQKRRCFLIFTYGFSFIHETLLSIPLKQHSHANSLRILTRDKS
jgi:hypothetical protein